jgi:regulator of RNase E activity RraA
MIAVVSCGPEEGMTRIKLLTLMWLLPSVGMAQTAKLEIARPAFEVPAYVKERLSPSDQALFEKLTRVGLESVWAQLRAAGFEQTFINELTPLHPDRRLIGRARTMRYLPNRPDLRERIYSQRRQLNYVSADETEPGDVLVFDAGGDTRSGVSGAVTTLRAVVRGASGMVIDGAMRDVPDLAGMPMQVYLRRGQASSVSPNLMSVDYQVPVRIGNVTVAPGDILLGERHGILVIPAHLAEKVVDEALEHDELEEFQRKLLLEGRPIEGVYPPNEQVRREFEEYKKAGRK